MGRKRLHEDYWIIKISPESIWISNHIGNIIKVKAENPQLIADWLDGVILDDSEINKEIIKQLSESRLLMGDFWDLKIQYNDVHIIGTKNYEDLIEILLKETTIPDIPIQFSTEKPETPNKSTLYVYIQDSLNIDTLSKIDEWAHDNDITWMPVGLLELARISFGPVIIPFQSPCLECYFNRRKANGNPIDVNIRLGYENIQQPSLSRHEILLLLGLFLTRIQLGISVFVQNQSAVVSSFNRMGLDLVEDEIVFTPRCTRCSTRQYPTVEPYTPMSKR